MRASGPIFLIPFPISRLSYGLILSQSTVQSEMIKFFSKNSALQIVKELKHRVTAAIQVTFFLHIDLSKSITHQIFIKRTQQQKFFKKGLSTIRVTSMSSARFIMSVIEVIYAK